jgi:hypothetical protein
MKMSKANCTGCRDNFYNGNNGFGIQECWHLETAKVVLRRRVGMNDVPPWTATPEKLPNCYSASGYVFVEPTRTC